MNDFAGWSKALTVTADGDAVISRAGAAALRLTADRTGLTTAQAGLAALRGEFPDVEWHTLVDHMPDARAFWATVGVGVPGGYQQRDLCLHLR